MKNLNPTIFDLLIKKCFFDVDGTVNAMNHRWVGWINAEFEKNYKVSDVDEWDWYLGVRDRDRIDPFLWFKNNIPYEVGHEFEAIPFPNAKEVLNGASKHFMGNVFFLTSTHDHEIIPQKNEYIDHHFGEVVPPENVIHEHEKYKHAINPDGSINVLIDDKPDNCIKWVEAGGVAFLYSHNDEYVYSSVDYQHDRFIRISLLEDINTVAEKMNISSHACLESVLCLCESQETVPFPKI